MNILDKRFKYTPAAKTDIRKTFARERARLKSETRPDPEVVSRLSQIKITGTRGR